MRKGARDAKRGRARRGTYTQSPRRAVVPPSSFLRRRALLTKLFRDRAEKKRRTGETVVRRWWRRGRGIQGPVRGRTRGKRASGAEVGSSPGGAPGGREYAARRDAHGVVVLTASSSKRSTARPAWARVSLVAATFDGRSGGRGSSAPAEKAEEVEKEDVASSCSSSTVSIPGVVVRKDDLYARARACLHGLV